MSPIVFWMLGISFSSAMMIMIVAFDLRFLQFALSFVIVGFIALAGVRDHRALTILNAFPSHATATLIRHMGVIYGWAAVCIVLLYSLLMEWSHWVPAFLVMCSGATLCVFLANIMMRDLAEEAEDSNVIALVRSISKAQCAATCVAFGGLITLGKMSTSLGSNENWAAVNIMLCAALGIAALSGYVIVLRYLEAAEPQTDTPPVAKAAPTKAQGKAPVRTFGRATRAA
jgi:hypothetical protein